MYTVTYLSASSVKDLAGALNDLLSRKKFIQQQQLTTEELPDIEVPVVGKIIKIEQFNSQIIKPTLDPNRPNITLVYEMIVISEDTPIAFFQTATVNDGKD